MPGIFIGFSFGAGVGGGVGDGDGRGFAGIFMPVISCDLILTESAVTATSATSKARQTFAIAKPRFMIFPFCTLTTLTRRLRVGAA